MLSRRSNPRPRSAMISESIRRHHPISQRQLGQPPVDEVSPLNDSARYRSGILLFSRRKQLLHADRRALELIAHPDQLLCDPGCGIHVGPAYELLNAVQAALDHRRAASIWEPFELKHVIFEQRRKLVMRGLGLIDRESHDDSRIMSSWRRFAFDKSTVSPRNRRPGYFREQLAQEFCDQRTSGLLTECLIGAVIERLDHASDRN